MSEELASTIPSSYSHKTNHMDSTQDTGIILVQACGALRLVGTSFFSVFVCSITGAVACSYALECQMWDPDREAPTPPYIDIDGGLQ